MAITTIINSPEPETLLRNPAGIAGRATDSDIGDANVLSGPVYVTMRAAPLNGPLGFWVRQDGTMVSGGAPFTFTTQIDPKTGIWRFFAPPRLAEGRYEVYVTADTGSSATIAINVEQLFDYSTGFVNFPPGYIENAVDAPVTKYTRRLDIYEADNRTIWQRDVPMVSGSITVDQARTERRSASLTLYNEDGRLDLDRNDGFWYDKILRVVMGVEAPEGSWEAPLGTFLMDRIGSVNSSGATEVTVRDMSKKMAFPFPRAVSWPDNHPIEEIIDDIAGAAGVVDRHLPLTGVNTAKEFFFDQGAIRWTSAYEVATAHGYDLFFDPAGTLQMKEFADPTDGQPEFRFETGTDSNLVSINRSATDARIRNHIMVYGERPDGIPVWAEAVNNVADSPTNVTRLGYRTLVYKSEWVTDTDQAEVLAQQMLAYNSLEQYESGVSSAIVPWLEAGAVVQLEDPGQVPGTPDRFLLSNFTINLDLTPATAVLKRVTSVIDRFVPYPEVLVTDRFPSTTLFPNYPRT